MTRTWLWKLCRKRKRATTVRITELVYGDGTQGWAAYVPILDCEAERTEYIIDGALLLNFDKHDRLVGIGVSGDGPIEWQGGNG